MSITTNVLTDGHSKYSQATEPSCGTALPRASETELSDGPASVSPSLTNFLAGKTNSAVASLPSAAIQTTENVRAGSGITFSASSTTDTMRNSDLTTISSIATRWTLTCPDHFCCPATAAKVNDGNLTSANTFFPAVKPTRLTLSSQRSFSDLEARHENTPVPGTDDPCLRRP